MNGLTLLLGWVSLSLAYRAHGLVFYATGDPEHNTTPPTGDLAGSGWQWQGQWRGFAATPIAANLFLAAKHVGGTVGESFLFQGSSYPTVASYPDPGTDLIVWQVCGVFPTVAPLYSGPSEVGRECVVLGRGGTRGAEVTHTNNAGVVLKGWGWGPANGRLRWGQNRIVGITTGSTGVGKLLVAAFDRDGLPEEAGLITGDSGGGLFILNGSQWQLAGINYAVEGPFSYTSSGPPFYAALFDRGGLYQLGNGGVWQLISENPAALKPSAFYATQVAARLTWLRSLIAEHEGRDPLPSLLVSAMPQGPYEVATDASVDETTQTIRVPASGAARFYRLTACQVLRFSSIAAAGNQVLLKYEPTAQP